MVNVFRKWRFELLASPETKVKGNGEISWCGVIAICTCVQEKEIAREGVRILLNNLWHIVVVVFESVISRIL